MKRLRDAFAFPPPPPNPASLANPLVPWTGDDGMRRLSIRGREARSVSTTGGALAVGELALGAGALEPGGFNLVDSRRSSISFRARSGGRGSSPTDRCARTLGERYDANNLPSGASGERTEFIRRVARGLRR